MVIASKDSFKSDVFHSKCDKITNKLIIVKSNDNVFGGFSTVKWSGEGYKNDKKAFIFSFKNKHNKTFIMKVKNASNAIKTDLKNTVQFGDGDIFISNNSNANHYSYSHIGNNYELPDLKHENHFSFMAGSKNFRLKEIEV